MRFGLLAAVLLAVGPGRAPGATPPPPPLPLPAGARVNATESDFVKGGGHAWWQPSPFLYARNGAAPYDDLAVGVGNGYIGMIWIPGAHLEPARWRDEKAQRAALSGLRLHLPKGFDAVKATRFSVRLPDNALTTQYGHQLTGYFSGKGYYGGVAALLGPPGAPPKLLRLLNPALMDGELAADWSRLKLTVAERKALETLRTAMRHY